MKESRPRIQPDSACRFSPGGSAVASTLRRWLDKLRTDLIPIAGGQALAEAETILELVTGLARSDLYLSTAEPGVAAWREACRIAGRRRTGMPLAYASGRVFFYSREFFVTPDVLIPRQETEVLADTILQREDASPRFFADVGIGSGAIAAVLCAHRPSWQCVGIDISPAALAIARRNCPRNKMLMRADVLSSVKQSAHFDFVVSNPPYVSDAEMAKLDESVRRWEPHTELHGGHDGLRFFRQLLPQACHALRPGGRLYCEIGFSQELEIRKLFEAAGWKEILVLPDLGGRPRVAMAKRPLQGSFAR